MPAAAEHPSRDTDQAIRATRATYDEVGESYAAENGSVPETVRESLDWFVAALAPGAVVADVGCGPGRDLAELRARGLSAVGIDLSWGMLRSAGITGVAQADMSRLPVGTAVLEGIWCAAAFLHVPRALSVRTLEGFARAVRPGGALHLSVAEGDAEGVEQARYGMHGDLWVVQREEAELRRDLAAVGFAVTSVARSQSHRRWLTLGAVRSRS